MNKKELIIMARESIMETLSEQLANVLCPEEAVEKLFKKANKDKNIDATLLKTMFEKLSDKFIEVVGRSIYEKKSFSNKNIITSILAGESQEFQNIVNKKYVNEFIITILSLVKLSPFDNIKNVYGVKYSISEIIEDYFRLVRNFSDEKIETKKEVVKESKEENIMGDDVDSVKEDVEIFSWDKSFKNRDVVELEKDIEINSNTFKVKLNSEIIPFTFFQYNGDFLISIDGEKWYNSTQDESKAFSKKIDKLNKEDNKNE